MKPRKPLPPRTAPLGRSKPPQKAVGPRKPIKRKPRTASESERVYGPPDRRRLVVLGRCVGCKVQGTEERPLHQHHTPHPSKGMGHKADYAAIVGLCHQCHQYVHDHGPASYEKAAGLNLRQCAMDTEAAWRAYLGDVTD